MLSESWVPHHSSIYHTTEEEIWKYSYPLKIKQHVSPYAVPFIAILSPALTSLLFALFGKISMTELHHTLLVGTSCVAFTGVVTNTIKINVGRPRPNFLALCFGKNDNGERRFDPQGVPLCNDNAVGPDEGFKSFPSGHTSWSTSGLGYMAFWIMGKLPQNGVPHPLQTAGSMLPLLASALIGASRLQDSWHHPEDVIAGYMLGLLMAWVFYRRLYGMQGMLPVVPVQLANGQVAYMVQQPGGGGGGGNGGGKEERWERAWNSFGGLQNSASKEDAGINV
jgi:diacylglycerol diphosphate phosphatase / phosphatidate phosphatase